MAGGIYTITAPSGGQYVGSASSFSKRWSRHRKDLEAGCHPNFKLQNAFKKYGAAGLEFKQLLICESALLLFFEQRAIDILKPRYNINLVAGSCRGTKQSVETKAKRALSLKGHVVSAETREKIAAAQRGRKLAPEHAAKLRGKKRTPEQIVCIIAGRRAADSVEYRMKQSAAAKASWTRGDFAARNLV